MLIHHPKFYIPILATFCIVATHVKAESDNPYAQHYQAQPGAPKSLSTSPTPEIYLGKSKDQDNLSMLEKGYDMIGASAFEENDVSPDFAVEHAKNIGASTVIVYSKAVSQADKRQKLKAKIEAAKRIKKQYPNQELTISTDDENDKQYQYFASYWTKLPAPLLGVHVIKLVPKKEAWNENESAPDGLNIIAVIQDSPAAKAGLLKGDRLLRIAEQKLEKPEDLSQIVSKFKGQQVEIELLRAEKNIKSLVTIGGY